MKPLRHLALALLLVPLLRTHAGAQFSSGSDGSYGPINVTTGTTTLAMPDDGIFHATTINVSVGAILKFTPNALNTPVYLLATGDITIAGNVNVNGAAGTTVAGGVGGPGGFAGGGPSIAGSAPGAGFGPGGGLGGDITLPAGGDGATVSGGGSYSSRGNATTKDGQIYGSKLLVPLTGGSGGGGTTNVYLGGTNTPYGGGGGGGAVLLSSDTSVNVTGTVVANGGAGHVNTNFNSGSGGAVRIVAPAVTGNGGLQTLSPGPTGAGRIRIDLIDRSGLQLSYNPTSALAVGAFMAVFPTPLPRLDIIEACGDIIPEGTSTPVIITLPFDDPPERTVTVQATDFTGVVNIRVVLTPDSGDPIVYDDSIDMSTGNPASKAVDVVLPQNIPVRINAWTRD